ncbi:GNAT family N-acetyltransferase [Isachenkonia alkalipeptolytica]|uniref:GNAT family N-acetyltransferase n=1 Tax=Isachenkonia alkalipeptolytica TaxID=2565777 RepID=A0AA43XHS8_9CLOT|nr:GNAT family N-acetyltransferase [Isachenkonia alkalipeptolytica]NBG87077.1 GNAT family N-acetyltransferase [Isachenkonia alkalipeptolytica]
MDNIKVALEILSEDPIRNINLINFIKEYQIDVIHIEGSSVLVKGRSDQAWTYISSKSEAELNVLLKHLKEEDQHFATIEDWMLPFILKDRRLEWKLSCVKFYFPNNSALPENMVSLLELSTTDAQYIFENSKYQEYTSKEYIIERIQKGIGLGIYKNEKLVAWILTHDDGAMGFLHVLPEYRGKGYARELSIAMIRKLREQGEITFIHIEEDNKESMSLSRKMGFVKERLVHWVKIN